MKSTDPDLARDLKATLDQIAQAMDVHQIMLIALTYRQHAGKNERERILRPLQAEVECYIP